MQQDDQKKPDRPMDTEPWWRYGYLWLVLSGPAAVVVAALATGYIALRHQDPVVDENYYRHGININKTLAAERALLPGLEGSNHAATPTPVRP